MNTTETPIAFGTTTKWAIDATHSEIHFKVKHLLISTVTGQFNTFAASVDMEDDDLSTAKVHFTAEVKSISTNNEQRDGHLHSADFFDAENHPQVIFEGKQMEKVDDENYKIQGTLNMRGVCKDVVFDVEYGGSTIDLWGNTRIGFSLTGKINRKDYGVSFSMVSETGGILLGEEVKIIANAEFVRQVEN
ncbi:MAG: YceI family protein [Bacteroidota bacterium]|nr:YceI family protein [Bacteroidota bacterium]